jgi:hypothetical protein
LHPKNLLTEDSQRRLLKHYKETQFKHRNT